jgi:hypothetical protein
MAWPASPRSFVRSDRQRASSSTKAGTGMTGRNQFFIDNAGAECRVLMKFDELTREETAAVKALLEVTP